MPMPLPRVIGPVPEGARRPAALRRECRQSGHPTMAQADFFYLTLVETRARVAIEFGRCGVRSSDSWRWLPVRLID